MALIATHLGVIDEEQINNMSYIFFEDILDELGHKLTYDAVVNYAGNSFCEKSWDIIMENYPMNDHSPQGKSNSALKGLAGMINSSNIRVMKKGEKLPGTLGQ